MTIREAIQQQQKSIKNRSLPERISFFWEYYGIKTICLLLAVTALVAFIISMASKKDYAFTGVFFGAVTQENTRQYLSAFAADAGIDENQYALTVQCQPDIRMDQQITPEIYQSMETFTAMVASKSVDCFAGNEDLFLYYAYLEYATDLRTVLTQEELEKFSAYLHYVDGKLIEEQETANDGYANAYAQRPDSTKPELMQDPIPVAISLDAATAAFKEAYGFRDNAVIGICSGSEQSENALSFLRYCLN